jgi:putative solute:sodium symporter small subunit
MKRKIDHYWRSNIKIVFSLLIIWFIASFGFGILFSDSLDQIKIGGFKLGFWFAQQGSIYVFVVIIFLYVWLMKRLDRKLSEEEDI